MFGTLWECAGIIFPDTKFSNHGLFSLEKKMYYWMMENIKLMPDPLDLRELTFSNLLLLGFDVDVNEEQYRIPFTRY